MPGQYCVVRCCNDYTASNTSMFAVMLFNVIQSEQKHVLCARVPRMGLWWSSDGHSPAHGAECLNRTDLVRTLMQGGFTGV